MLSPGDQGHPRGETFTLGFDLDNCPLYNFFGDPEPEPGSDQCANPECTRPAKIRCEKCKLFRYCAGGRLAKRCRALHVERHGHGKTCRPGSMEFEIQLYSDHTNPTGVVRLVSCPLESTFAEFADVIRAAFNWRAEHIFDFRVLPNDGRHQTRAEMTRVFVKMKEIEAISRTDRFRIEDYLPSTFSWPAPPYFHLRIVPYDVPLNGNSVAQAPDNWYIPGDRTFAKRFLYLENLSRWHQQTPEVSASSTSLAQVLDKYPGHELDFVIDFKRGWRHRIMPRRRQAYREPVCHPQFFGHHAFEDYPIGAPEDGLDLLPLKDLPGLLARDTKESPVNETEECALLWFYDVCTNGGCLCFHENLEPTEQCYKGGVVNLETAIYRKKTCLRPTRIATNPTDGSRHLVLEKGPDRGFPPVLSQKKDRATGDLSLDFEENAGQGSSAPPNQKKNKKKKRKGKSKKKPDQTREEVEEDEPEQQKQQEQQDDESKRNELAQTAADGLGSDGTGNGEGSSKTPPPEASPKTPPPEADSPVDLSKLTKDELAERLEEFSRATEQLHAETSDGSDSSHR